MASGDNVDVIEVVETSFTGPVQATEDHLRPEQYADEDKFGSATWHHRAQNLFGGFEEQIRTGEKDWPQKSWSGR